MALHSKGGAVARDHNERWGTRSSALDLLQLLLGVHANTFRSLSFLVHCIAHFLAKHCLATCNMPSRAITKHGHINLQC